MRVPFFRYSHVFAQQHAELSEVLLEVTARGRFILQEELRHFEQELAGYVGCADAIGVGNATDALEMLVEDIGLRPGDEVIMPSHTFVSAASAVVRAGASPVFAEIGRDHLLDPDDVEARITSRTRCIMPTQLNGRVADMERITCLAERHGVLVLEDSAQGIGARFRGRMAGTFGAGGVLSFYPAKVLGCFGDGGAILTKDPDAALRFRRRRDHGRDPETGVVMGWGRNSRLDNLQAALLRVKLGVVDQEIARRRERAARYDVNLRDVGEVELPPPPHDGGERFDTFQNYEIEADERDRLRTFLSEREVGTTLQWGGKGVHQIESLGTSASLPKTELMFRRALMLPMNTSLSLDEIDYVSEQIRQFYGASK